MVVFSLVRRSYKHMPAAVAGVMVWLSFGKNIAIAVRAADRHAGIAPPQDHLPRRWFEYGKAVHLMPPLPVGRKRHKVFVQHPG